MKLSQPSRNFRSVPRGVALVIVLSMLVLLSALLVAFMTTATTERAASFANAGVANSRQIADSTVSFVISQIRDATSITDEKTTWASQPGAIRTFAGALTPGAKQTGSLPNGAYWDDYSPSGASLPGGRPAEAVYKLYSSDKMLVPAGDYATQDLNPTSKTGDVYVVENWSSIKESDNERDFPDYVDLNKPILSPRRDIAPFDGTVVEPRYPIIDPRAKLNTSNAEGNPGIVDGFDAKIVFDDKTKRDMVTLDGKSAAKTGVPYLPLPVKWLYVLRDGTMGPASLATEQNPIVGRTAFWTDDESCKLNINTASEGTFWDTPSASSMQEMGKFATSGIIGDVDRGLNLSASQPVRGEYQRYPGHPATTSLSPVLGWLWGISSAPGTASTAVNPYLTGGENKTYNKYKQAIYRLTPFMPYGAGTSRDGTYNTDYTADSEGKLNVGTKHLYASVDDMLFRSGRFTTGGGTPDLNLIDPGAAASAANTIPPEAIERLRFFLTTNSRAPELNLFSRPRVTTWPVNASPRYRTSFDDLFVFTSTLAKGSGTTSDQRYCFLRGDAKDQTRDFLGTWPNLNPAVNDDRNQKLFEYLQNMTSLPVPGFGKTFATKWGGPNVGDERDEILLLIMDYMRTVNLTDTGTTTRQNASGGNNVFAPYTPRFFYAATPANQYSRYDRSYDWSGQVTPLRNPLKNPAASPYQGMGRFIIPSEVAIVFTGTPPPAGQPATSKYMRATLVMEMSTVMPGLPAIRETFWTRLIPRRATKIKVGNGTFNSYNFCGDNTLAAPGSSVPSLVNVNNVSSHETGQGRGYMPTLGMISWMYHFPEHKAPTFVTPGSLEGTVLNPTPVDSNRNGTFPDPTPKLFDNSKTVNKDTTGVSPYGFVRDKPNAPGTVSYYPYVSDPILIPQAGAPQTFAFMGGEYDIEIYSGEAPDDPRSQLVQKVKINFPKDVTVPASGSFTVPTTTDLRNRLALGLEGPTDIIVNGDVVRSMELTVVDMTQAANLNKSGDLRLAAARSDVPDTYYFPRDGMARYTSTTPIIHGLVRGWGGQQTGHSGTGLLAPSGAVRGDKVPILPAAVRGVIRDDGGPGDWDRGLSKHMDGAFGGKVDEGNLKFDYSGGTDHTVMPYFRGRGIEETGQTFFTPNRQMPSAVMFGSIPTGVVNKKPWQTLLFRPNREVGTIHPGADTNLGPPDHLMLDLFHMPVVEPYAISEPFSTAGKVNMNYVMAPFGYAKGAAGSNPDTNSQARSYVRRDTALRGVLKSTFMMAVPTAQGNGGHDEGIENVLTPFRYPVDSNRTLEEFEARLKYKAGQYPLFRSASEICTIDLYPKSATGAAAPTINGWDAFWKANAITGDNMRERPYAHIYPRLTTKSNVYTVHMRCQAIRKSTKSVATEFDPRLDSVVGEYRGSATIERFIDPNDPALANYNPTTQKVDSFYRYRVVNTKLFAPK